MTEINGEKAYTTREVAEILGKSMAVVQKYTREGRIEAVPMNNRKIILESSLKAYAGGWELFA